MENVNTKPSETEGEEDFGIGSLFFTAEDILYTGKRIDNQVLEIFLFATMMLGTTLITILTEIFMVALSPINWLLLKYRGKGLWVKKNPEDEENFGIGSLFFTKKSIWYKIDNQVLEIFFITIMMLVITPIMILTEIFMVALSPINWLLLKYRGKGLWLTKRAEVVGLIHRPKSTRDNN